MLATAAKASNRRPGPKKRARPGRLRKGRGGLERAGPECAETEQRGHGEAPGLFVGLEAGLRQESGARQGLVLLALRYVQVGHLHLRILIQRQLYGVVQREPYRRGVLRTETSSRRERD